MAAVIDGSTPSIASADDPLRYSRLNLVVVDAPTVQSSNAQNDNDTGYRTEINSEPNAHVATERHWRSTTEATAAASGVQDERAFGRFSTKNNKNGIVSSTIGSVRSGDMIYPFGGMPPTTVSSAKSNNATIAPDSSALHYDAEQKFIKHDAYDSHFLKNNVDSGNENSPEDEPEELLSNVEAWTLPYSKQIYNNKIYNSARTSHENRNKYGNQANSRQEVYDKIESSAPSSPQFANRPSNVRKYGSKKIPAAKTSATIVKPTTVAGSLMNGRNAITDEEAEEYGNFAEQPMKSSHQKVKKHNGDNQREVVTPSLKIFPKDRRRRLERMELIGSYDLGRPMQRRVDSDTNASATSNTNLKTNAQKEFIPKKNLRTTVTNKRRLTPASATVTSPIEEGYLNELTIQKPAIGKTSKVKGTGRVTSVDFDRSHKFENVDKMKKNKHVDGHRDLKFKSQRTDSSKHKHQPIQIASKDTSQKTKGNLLLPGEAPRKNEIKLSAAKQSELLIYDRTTSAASNGESRYSTICPNKERPFTLANFIRSNEFLTCNASEGVGNCPPGFYCYVSPVSATTHNADGDYDFNTAVGVCCGQTQHCGGINSGALVLPTSQTPVRCATSVVSAHGANANDYSNEADAGDDESENYDRSGDRRRGCPDAYFCRVASGVCCSYDPMAGFCDHGIGLTDENGMALRCTVTNEYGKENNDDYRNFFDDCPSGYSCVARFNSTLCCPTQGNVCSQPLHSGASCVSSPPLLVYGFDAASQACMRFHYDGCAGNDNRFDSKADCEEYCTSQSEHTLLSSESNGRLEYSVRAMAPTNLMNYDKQPAERSVDTIAKIGEHAKNVMVKYTIDPNEGTEEESLITIKPKISEWPEEKVAIKKEEKEEELLKDAS